MSCPVLLGYIAKAFGIKGGVFVKLINDEGDTLTAGKKILLRQSRRPEQELTITEIMDGGRMFLSGIDDRLAAEGLKGAELWIQRQEFLPLPDDEYYLSDLLGANVEECDGKPVGEIIGFSSNGAQILFEVKTKSSHVASIPSVKPIVQKIDVEKKLVVINAPIGLLDDLTCS